MPRIYMNPDAVANAASEYSWMTAEAVSFHRRLNGYAPTPLHALESIASELKLGTVFVKAETSRFGLPAFKILGASWAVYKAVSAKLELLPASDLSLEELADHTRGSGITLFAATDGNHGRAVARMAKLLHLNCVVYVPAGLDSATRKHIESEGARPIQALGDYDVAVAEADASAKALDGGLLIQDNAFPGYEEVPRWIVEGYSTMFVELDEQVASAAGDRSPDAVIVPVGVGSLAHAAIAHYKRDGRNTLVVAVEPDTASCLKRSLASAVPAGSPPPSFATSATIMTGLNCGTVSSIAWPLLKTGIDAAVTVADIEADRAVEELQAAGVAIGPCGAAPLAALRLLTSSGKLTPDSIVVLLGTEGPRTYAAPHDSTTVDPVALTQILTRIDSSNPGLGGGPGERAIADYLSAWLAHHGFEIHRFEGTHGRPSIVGVARGSGSGKSFMFNGHVDTVTLASYEGDALSGDIVDGRVYGRGTFDMKGGVAASLVAALRAKNSAQLRGDIILALVADEENLSLGTQEMLAAGWRADAAVICEPGAALMPAHKGFTWFEVDVLGKAAHGSRPDLGTDAIAKAGHFLVALERYGDALLQGTHPESVKHPLLGTGSVHAGKVRGGEEVSSYPALCTVQVERRTVPGETAERVEAQLREILEELKQTVPSFRYALRRGDVRPPYEIDAQHPYVLAFLEHAKAVLARAPPIAGATYWADSAFLGEKGIPTVLFGIDGEGAHAATEWASVESIKQVAEILTNVVRDFCT